MTTRKCTTFLGELELLKKEVKQQESKYLFLLGEHEKAKLEKTESDAAYQTKLDAMKKLFNEQTVKHSVIQSENVELAGQLKGIRDDNHRMSLDIDRISQAPTDTKLEISNMVEAFQSKFDAMKKLFDEQSVKFSAIQSENVQLAGQYKGIRDDNHRMRLDIDRISQVPKDTKLEISNMRATFQSKFDAMKKLFDEQSVKCSAIQTENVALAGQLKNMRDDNHRMRRDTDRIPQTPSQSLDKTTNAMSDHERAIWVYNKLPCQTLQEIEIFGTELLNPKIFVFLQNYMQVFGGNLNKFISHMINKIASKELQSKLSYSGHRTTNHALTSMPTVVNLLHLSAKVKFNGYDTENGIKIISGLLKQA